MLIGVSLLFVFVVFIMLMMYGVVFYVEIVCGGIVFIDMG